MLPSSEAAQGQQNLTRQSLEDRPAQDADRQSTTPSPGRAAGSGLKKELLESASIEGKTNVFVEKLETWTPEKPVQPRKRPRHGLEDSPTPCSPATRRAQQLPAGQSLLHQYFKTVKADSWDQLRGHLPAGGDCLTRSTSQKAAPAGTSPPQIAATDDKQAQAGYPESPTPANNAPAPPAPTLAPPPPAPDLNAEQRAAAYSDIHKACLIVAGAGSGKTQTLLERGRHIKEADPTISGSQILGFTFSRKCADELRERQRRACPHVPGSKDMKLTTIHAQAYGIVAVHHQALGFTARPTVCGADPDRRAFLKEAIRVAELEVARRQVVSWLNGDPGIHEPHLPADSRWPSLLDAARRHHPALYQRQIFEAEAVIRAEEQKHNKSKAKKAQRAAEDGLRPQAGQGMESDLFKESAVRRMHLLEKAQWVFDGLLALYTGLPQPEPKAGSVPKPKRVSQMYQWLRTVKNHGHVAEMYCEGTPFGRTFQSYQYILLACNVMDYDDMLSMALKLLKTRPGALARARHDFKYLLVDEFQDLNPTQVAIVKLLQEHSGRVTAVGDTLQGIYGFRGADRHVFSDFEEDFGHADLRHQLTVNYRSRPAILVAANAAVSGTQGPDVVVNTLIPHKAATDNPVRICSFSHPEHEAQEIALRVVKRHAEGVPYEAMAVLMPSIKKGASDALQDELSRKGLPFRVGNQKPFNELAVVRDAASLLSLSVNSSDDRAFLRMLNKPRRGLGSAIERELQGHRSDMQLASGVPVSLFVAAKRMRDRNLVPPRAVAKFREYVTFVERLPECCLGLSPDQALFFTLRGSGYLAWRQAQARARAWSIKARQDASMMRRQPASSDDSDQEDDPPYSESSSDEDDTGKESQAGSPTATLRQADRRLGQLHDMAVRFIEEWTSPWEGVDDPAGDGSNAVPTSLSLEAASSADVLRDLPRDVRDRVFAHRKQGPVPLADFLAGLSTDKQARTSQKGVHIGTIHSAKGLEWTDVYVLRCIDGMMPWHYYAAQDLPPSPTHAHPHAPNVPMQIQATQEEHDAEGHRLVYVALTRPREQLTLACLRFLRDPAMNCREYDPVYRDADGRYDWDRLKGEMRLPPKWLLRVKAVGLPHCRVETERTEYDIARGMTEDFEHICRSEHDRGLCKVN